MANTTFQLRRSSVAGKVPNTSTLSIGELGLNLTDQILYSSNGTGVFELGANVTNQTVKTSLLVGNSTVNTTINSSSISVLSIIANGSVGTDSQVLTSNGTGIYWSNSSVSGASRTYSVTTVSGTQNTFTTPGQFVTGTTDVYLNGVHLSNSDYLEVNSTAIQLTSDATDGSIVEVSGWVTINTLVAGANTTIQFNDSGYINSSSTFTWNKDTELLTVGNSSVNTQIVAGNVFLNGSTLVVGNTSTNVTINSTSVSIGANNLTVGTSLYAVSNGNVGIGTSSPYSSLSIVKDQAYNAGVGDTSITQIVVDNPNASGFVKYALHQNGSSKGILQYNCASPNIFLSTNANTIPLYLGTDNSIRMAITGAGNVGIGTSSPTSKLNIKGNAVLGAVGYLDGDTNNYSFSIQTNQSVGNYVNIYLARMGNAGMYLTQLTSQFAIGPNADGSSPYLAINNAGGSIGNVGIGTGVPGNKLEILSDGSSQIRVGDSFQATFNSYYDFGRDSTDGLFSFDGAQTTFVGYKWKTNGTERMRITSAGYVGIGTSSPSGTLDVRGSGSYYFGNVSNPRLRLLNTGGTASTFIVGSDSGGVWLGAETNSFLYFISNNTERMRIDASGNVGIGSSSPKASLHISGSAILQQAYQTYLVNAYYDGAWKYIENGMAWGIGNNFGGPTNGMCIATATVNSSGNDAALTWTPRLNITSAGNVGIGTTSPSSTLEVNGSFAATSKSFIIPHPLPDLSETNNLVHSNVEAPTADNIYRGKIQLVNGQATVNIDTYVGMTEGTFSALNGNIQVFLQNESGWDLVRGSVTDNILTIISQNQSSTDTISWMVIGERQDQHMLDTQWTDEFGRPILEPLKEPEPDVALPPEPDVALPPEPDVALPPEPGVPNENG